MAFIKRTTVRTTGQQRMVNPHRRRQSHHGDGQGSRRCQDEAQSLRPMATNQVAVERIPSITRRTREMRIAVERRSAARDEAPTPVAILREVGYGAK